MDNWDGLVKLTCHACLVWEAHKSSLTECGGHDPNSWLKRRRLSSLRSCLKQQSRCSRFPCRAPSYLSNIFLLLSTRHLEKRQVTLLCRSAVPGLGVPRFPPDLRVHSDVGAHRGALQFILPSCLLVPGTGSQISLPVSLSSDTCASFLWQSMTDDGHNNFIAFLKPKYCLF